MPLRRLVVLAVLAGAALAFLSALLRPRPRPHPDLFAVPSAREPQVPVVLGPDTLVDLRTPAPASPGSAA